MTVALSVITTLPDRLEQLQISVRKKNNLESANFALIPL
jgi:hypothetical protein